MSVVSLLDGSASMNQCFGAMTGTLRRLLLRLATVSTAKLIPLDGTQEDRVEEEDCGERLGRHTSTAFQFNHERAQREAPSNAASIAGQLSALEDVSIIGAACMIPVVVP